MNNEILGWYNGDNIGSAVTYYPKTKELKQKVQAIQFMGHSSVTPTDSSIKLSLYCRVVEDGITHDEWFNADPNEDGSFPPETFQDLLRKADLWFEKFITKPLTNEQYTK